MVGREDVKRGWHSSIASRLFEPVEVAVVVPFSEKQGCD